MASEDKDKNPEQPDQVQGNGNRSQKPDDQQNKKNGTQDGDQKKGEGKEDDKKKEDDPKEKRKKKITFVVFGVVLLLAAIAGLIYWLHKRNFEDTDDAQVDGNLAPVGSRVNGTINKVYVDNNSVVKAGDLLVELDDRDYQISLEQVEAQFEQAENQVTGQRPNIPITRVQNITGIRSSGEDVASAEAGVASAARDRDQNAQKIIGQEAMNIQAQNDLKRYTELVQKWEVSKQDYDKYVATAKQQQANLDAMREALRQSEENIKQQIAKLNQSRSQLQQSKQNAEPALEIQRATLRQREASLKQSRAQLDSAKLNLAYTKIYAPVSGIILKRAAQIGARVSAGQQLLTISEVGNLWITANFKETQMRRMRPNQKVTVHIDALDRNFDGFIFTIGGATGSVASTLPPENATGNYVKVVQRIPVRINLDPNQDGADRLRPGMSAVPKARVD